MGQHLLKTLDLICHAFVPNGLDFISDAFTVGAPFPIISEECTLREGEQLTFGSAHFRVYKEQARVKGSVGSSLSRREELQG